MIPTLVTPEPVVSVLVHLRPPRRWTWADHDVAGVLDPYESIHRSARPFEDAHRAAGAFGPTGCQRDNFYPRSYAVVDGGVSSHIAGVSVVAFAR